MIVFEEGVASGEALERPWRALRSQRSRWAVPSRRVRDQSDEELVEVIFWPEFLLYESLTSPLKLTMKRAKKEHVPDEHRVYPLCPEAEVRSLKSRRKSCVRPYCM